MKNKRQAPPTAAAKRALAAPDAAPRDRRASVVAFAVSLLVLFCWHQVKNITVFYWDAIDYYRLADIERLLAGPETMRGIVFPLLLSPIHAIVHFVSRRDHTLFAFPYRLSMSVVYSIALAVALPAIYVRIFGGTLTAARRLIVPVLAVIFFSGLLLLPLSDLPACLMLLGAVNLLVRARRSDLAGNTVTWSIFCAGLLAGAAYNTRTIYLFSVALLVIAVPWLAARSRGVAGRVVMTALFLTGAFAANIPQAMLNLKIHHSFTPQVITTQAGLYAEGLFAFQLRTGIRLQRYMTDVTPGNPSPGVSYLDPAGERIYAAENLASRTMSLPTYAGLVVRHPLDFAGIFFRHLVNGLDVRDGEVYLNESVNTRGLRSFFNYCILFVGGWVLVLRCATWRDSRTKGASSGGGSSVSLQRQPADDHWWFWLLVVLLPVLAIVPGAIETRFFIPLHLLVYCTIAFNSSVTQMRLSLQRRPGLIGVSFVGLYGAWFLITEATLAHRIWGLPE